MDDAIGVESSIFAGLVLVCDIDEVDAVLIVVSKGYGKAGKEGNKETGKEKRR
jgi:hypothetical protein